MRLTRSAEGVVAADGASSGRGAWLCRGGDGDELVVEQCLETALARRAFARAWRRDVDAGDEAAIRARVGRAADRDGDPDAR